MIARLSVSEVARMLLPFGSNGGLCMLISYSDDSGTHLNSNFVVMSSIVGKENDWESFQSAWNQKLGEPLPGKPRLSKFHMTECFARTGEFSGYSIAERDAVIK